MQNKKITVPAVICFGLILANFITQVPYYFHLYFQTQPLSITLRSLVIMGVVFAFFLSGPILLFNKKRLGYWLTISFLSIEFLFYLLNQISSVSHGYGLFFQINNPDLTLRVIYSIGYTNLFACGYLLFLLMRYRDFFLGNSG
jgi:hypothetical protein